jgi:hypothetical protein
MWEIFVEPARPHENMAHAQYMQSTYGKITDTDTHTHTHTQNSTYCFIFDEVLLISQKDLPSHINWEIVQRFIYHYSLFSPTVRLRKDTSKRIFFCFNAASDTIHRDRRTFCCCGLQELSITALLCNIQHYYVSDQTLRMHCCVSTTKIAKRKCRTYIAHFV